MTGRPIIPPPPGTDPCQWAVPGEAALLVEWDERVRAIAHRVRYRGRLGMELDDVENELRMAMLTAIRKYAAENRQLPPPQFLTTVLHRRAMHFNRSARVWHRVIEDMVRSRWEEDYSPLVSAGGLLPDQRMAESEEAAAYRALVYILRTKMPPAVFAILHLRIVEGMDPMGIAEVTGIPSNTRASKRVAYAKRVAWAFLQSLGIHTWEQVRDAVPEDFNYDT